MKKSSINTIKILAGAGALLSVLAGCQLFRHDDGPAPGRWLAGDFHNHTVLTDGSQTPDEVFAHAFQFGLDWLANSEHGGAFAHNPAGQPWPAATVLPDAPPEGAMWRWQSLWQHSFPIVARTRAAFPDKLIVQGYEWNVPAHDHASVAIIGPAEQEGLAIARHEYLFDRDDTGATAHSQLGVGGKSTANNHDKAVAGVSWLAANYPSNSYFLINHPSRQLAYPIAAIRDFNNAAPDVAFGFEGMPGHQKLADRGAYNTGPWRDAAGRDVTSKARTYGGADFMLARIGGPWDALLGEGRRFFTFVNSDFHSPAHDFWPGEYARIHTFVPDQNHDNTYSPGELLAGLRSGNSFIAHGGLIDGLRLTAQCSGRTMEMGGILAAGAGCDLQLTIRFHSPAKNNSGAAMTVDHIDLIAGEIRGKAARYLGDGTTPNPDYDKDSNETARVVATFTRRDWREDEADTARQNNGEGQGGEGWHTINYHLGRPDRDMYFRLRGTNLGRGVANETDDEGNPLSDELMTPNTADRAYADLWFYSNPVFVRVAP
ncbi:MAG: hypothetical protein AB1545_15710 [Thermodesulfobacteriota bacterium]